MLLQFSVENFRSFKERAVLSMEALKRDTSHADHMVAVGKERLLKTAVIFGANSAGKSNFFLALTAAILALRQSNDRQMGAPIPMMMPFKFSEETIKKPSSFEFVFLAEGKKYVYGFSATRERVTKEYLYVYNSPRPSTIFERDSQSETEYKFTNSSIRKILQPLTGRNTPNKLFLATATSWNAEVTRAPFLWFQQGIDTYSNNYESLVPKDFSMLEQDADNKLKQFIRGILRKADINIENYDFESQNESAEKFLERLPPQVRSVIPAEIVNSPHKTFSIRTVHTVKEPGKEEKIFQMDLMSEESQGTKNIFMLSPVLYEAFHKGKIICVDEFDASLHPLLVSFLIGLFNNPDINTANAQLIISSHTTTLLARHLSRDDEIYFVDKNNETGESELYSLDDFSTRRNLDIRKAYLLGRFGAIPYIKEGGVL